MPAARLQLRPELGQVSAYRAEEAPARILLDAKENPYAPPARFLKRAAACLARAQLNRYPDPQARALKAAASKHYGLPASRILVGNGSDELLGLLCQAAGGQRAKCLLPTPTFGMYRLCARLQGLKVIEEPLGPAWELTDRFLARAEAERPALIFLAWPNSPTGNLFEPAAIRRLLALKGTLVVVDEAYAEFCGKSFRPLIARHPNLAVTSTFSKAWGLAGLRVGFLFAQEGLLAEVEKLRLPYNLDGLALQLAELALKSPGDFAPRWQAVLATRPRLLQGLKALPGATVYPSQANFLMLRHPRAKALNQALLRAGIRVRTLFGTPGLQDALQVTVGTDKEAAALLRAARQFLSGRPRP
jgi:histidinol-phosphate aminotransferase